MRRAIPLLLAGWLLAVPLSLLCGKLWLPVAAWTPDDPRFLILVELRLPRTLLALVVGGGLGLAGAVMQGYLRNPLADPGLFGVSAGAALGAVLALFLGLAAPLALPACALAGGAATMALLAAIAGRTGSLVLFTLAGLVVTSLAGSLTALVISLAPSPFVSGQIVSWLNGALTDRSWADLRLAAPFVAAGAIAAWRLAPALDALTLGEAAARSLGVDVRRTQALVVVATALLVGAGVAVAGVIGFVGLMVPHLVRPLVGHRPGALLLPSALGGGLLLLLADCLVRALPTVGEIRLGIAMSLLGAPFFLLLLRRLRRVLA